MRFSRGYRASNHCLPSPDGNLVATLDGESLVVRIIGALQDPFVSTLFPRLIAPGPVLAFKWAPSSKHVLIATANELHCLWALPEDLEAPENFHAVINNPVQPGDKPGFVDFGVCVGGPSRPSERPKEILMTSSLGLKLSVFSMSSLKTLEISNPKFYGVSNASSGFSMRRSGHLAVLTRTQGKDVVSVHDPETRESICSFNPDTIDAHGLTWSPDGRWLVVWEGPAHGHKVLCFAPDGHLFKAWCGRRFGSDDGNRRGSDGDGGTGGSAVSHGPACDAATRDDYTLGAGVRLLRFSADSRHLAIGDFTLTVSVLDMASVLETVRFMHPQSLVPREGLQVFLEKVNTSAEVGMRHTFVRATQIISPTSRSPNDKSELKTGCSSLSFDRSGALLATVLDNWPGTVWVWDLHTRELRAALLFHSSIATISWHPRLPETLLISCEGEAYAGVAFVWDPLSNGPKSIEIPPSPESQQKTSQPSLLPSSSPAKCRGKCQAFWMDVIQSEAPAVFISDGAQWRLAAVVGPEDESIPWSEDDPSDISDTSTSTIEETEAADAVAREESPLELVPAPGVFRPGRRDDSGDDSELDDTFHFKQRPGPRDGCW